MSILISRTHTDFTEESIQDGESSDSGFISENEPVSFKELVSLMQEHTECSSRPNSGSVFDWFSNSFIVNYAAGTERTESMHYSRDNPARKAKYWKLAAKIAGLLK